MKNTNHDKNLDYIYDNHPDMLDSFIDVYENSIFAVDHTISPEDMIDITEMIIAFEKEKALKLNQIYYACFFRYGRFIIQNMRGVVIYD